MMLGARTQSSPRWPTGSSRSPSSDIIFAEQLGRSSPTDWECEMSRGCQPMALQVVSVMPQPCWGVVSGLMNWGGGDGGRRTLRFMCPGSQRLLTFSATDWLRGAPPEPAVRMLLRS